MKRSCYSRENVWAPARMTVFAGLCYPEMKKTLGSSREMSVLITPRSLESARGRGCCRLGRCGRAGVSRGGQPRGAARGGGGRTLAPAGWGGWGCSAPPGFARPSWERGPEICRGRGHRMGTGAVGAPGPRGRAVLPAPKASQTPSFPFYAHPKPAAVLTPAARGSRESGPAARPGGLRPAPVRLSPPRGQPRAVAQVCFRARPASPGAAAGTGDGAGSRRGRGRERRAGLSRWGRRGAAEGWRWELLGGLGGWLLLPGLAAAMGAMFAAWFPAADA